MMKSNDIVNIHGKDVSLVKIEEALLQFPQTECPVIHTFGPGVYIREITIPVGAIAIGQHQKNEHLNIFLKGKLLMLDSNGEVVEKVAPLIFTGSPGKKVGYILETVTWLNVYATDETDIEILEGLLFCGGPNLTNFTVVPKSSDVDAILSYYKLLFELNLTEENGASKFGYSKEVTPIPYGSYKFKISKSNIDGKGVFATADFSADEVIGPFSVCGAGTCLRKFINHSSSPNAEVAGASDALYLKALTEIKGNLGGFSVNEVTIDYRALLVIENQGV